MANIFQSSEAKRGRSINSSIRIIALFLIIIQSIGIRFFSGQGITLGVLILILSVRGLVSIRIKDCLALLAMLGYVTFNKLINPVSFQANDYIFQMILVLVAYVFLLQYRFRGDLMADFYVVFKILCYYALAGYLVYVLSPKSFVLLDINDLKYRSFYRIFYVSDLDFDGLKRNVGLCWEPGLMQLVFNIFLFLNIRRNSSTILMFVCLLGVITTFSTAGYIILAINFAYFLSKNFTLRKSIIMVLGVIAGLFFFALVEKNITEKFNESNTSGLVRLRDIKLGYDLIAEKPLFGHGLFTADYLKSRPYVSQLEASLFSPQYLQKLGEMSGGYTNGLLGLAAEFGVPVAVILYYLFYSNKIILDNKRTRFMFFLVVFVTLISEPITNTSFFLLFPFSSFILRGLKYKQARGPNKAAGNFAATSRRISLITDE